MPPRKPLQKIANLRNTTKEEKLNNGKHWKVIDLDLMRKLGSAIYNLRLGGWSINRISIYLKLDRSMVGYYEDKYIYGLNKKLINKQGLSKEDQ
jgi:hypothetical protein